MDFTHSLKQEAHKYEIVKADDKYTSTESPVQKAKRIKEQISIQKVKYLMNPLMKKSPSAHFFQNISFQNEGSLEGSQNNEIKQIDCPFDRFQILTSGKKDMKSPIRKKQNNTVKMKYKYDYSENRQKIYNLPLESGDYDISKSALERKRQILNCEDNNFKANFQYSQTISTNTSSFYEGLKITDFSLGKQLGAGKFGEVFLARHKKTGFVCAIKRVKKNSLDEILKKQLIRQLKIQMYLQHPNIVKLYSFFSDSHCIYLVLELCTSGQLYHFLKRQKVPVSQQLGKVIIRQVCQGLDYIHENNIIHRDLKPQNILYHCGMMKICDFGWSINTHLMRDTFCGTPLYLSPELLKRNDYDKKIDSWSLGVLAYEILLGKVPFEIYSEADYIKIIKNEIKLSCLSGLSEEAKQFLQLCLEKDPQNRLSTAEMLAHPFLNKAEVINFPEIF